MKALQYARAEGCEEVAAGVYPQFSRLCEAVKMAFGSRRVDGLDFHDSEFRYKLPRLRSCNSPPLVAFNVAESFRSRKRVVDELIG
eukprot:1303670-Amphidinium_carterae.1